MNVQFQSPKNYLPFFELFIVPTQFRQHDSLVTTFVEFGHWVFGLSAIRVEDEFVSRKPLAAGRGKEPAASALRFTWHRNQNEWRRAVFVGHWVLELGIFSSAGFAVLSCLFAKPQKTNENHE